MEHDWSNVTWEASLVEAAEKLHSDVVIALLRKRSTVSIEGFGKALCHAINQRHMRTIVALASNVASSGEERRRCLGDAIYAATRTQQVRRR